MPRTRREESAGVIRVRGARQNNLKGIDVDLPLGKLIVVSGPSGSGKSSLAFDTLYAEGQRRYIETFSPYTRQFLERMDRPQVDEIGGIPPAVAVGQANPVRTSRSTVGTITEINDYLKLLMPRLAQASCPDCRRPVQPETAGSIVARALAGLADQRVLVTFGVPVPPGRSAADFFAFLAGQGYARVWVHGRLWRADEPAGVGRLPAVVQVVQDRLTVAPRDRGRLAEAVETALRFGKGKMALVVVAGQSEDGPGAIAAPAADTDATAKAAEMPAAAVHPFSAGWHCAHCDVDLVPPTPGLFSFNHPLGACPGCRGFGRVIGIDYDRAVPDPELSLAAGAIKPFQGENGRECLRDLRRHGAARGLDFACPFNELPAADQRWVLFGDDARLPAEDLWQNDLWYGVRGYFEWLESRAYKMHVRVQLSRYRSYTECPACGGGRFGPATLNYRLAGRTLPELAALPVTGLRRVIDELAAAAAADPSVELVRAEIASRLGYLEEVGLGYLALGRQTRTLSGGEIERVNLTTCLGASLVNTLFVLDEPSIGLHPRDVGRLIGILRQLRDAGNTLLVVEHDEAVLRAADHFVELGPGRGEAGGELVYEGPAAKVGRTLTGDYLAGRKRIPVPKRRRKGRGWLRVEGAAAHNLRGIDVAIPLGVFTCLTGVSGSGKSTLLHDVLYRNLQRLRGEPVEETPGRCRRLVGAAAVGRVAMVDQTPLARTPRSTPAVYLGVFDAIRETFAMLPEARAAGLSASAFSFNAAVGRCGRCAGMGFEKVEMQFLSDLFLVCPECGGTRYQAAVLKIRCRGRSIHEVLGMTVTEALEFFAGDRRIVGPLGLLAETGLGYLRLGQPLNTLSGGESQRLKLVGHLREGDGKPALFLLDEPTTGLHLDDIAMLLKVFDRLVAGGHTLLVVEHHLDVIKCADHLIDLGPEAGEGGGRVVATGTPEAVAAGAPGTGSWTGRFLRGALGRAGRGDRRQIVGRGEAAARARESAGGPAAAPAAGVIEVVGAREHNLKNLTLAIPRDRLVVVTGLSGSGKSTLVFDLLFAEGQRRFLDSMSAYARQFIEQLERPDVDRISGLPPAVAIEQRITRGGGKSTVATVTEVYHFLRLLFAKLGTQHCPDCGSAVAKRTPEAIAREVRAASRAAGRGGVRVLAPLVRGRKGFHAGVASWAERQGFDTLWVDGRFVPVAEFRRLERFREHSLDVVVGRGPGCVERALEIGRGTIRLASPDGELRVLSTELNCPGCGRSFEALDPRLFSFHSPHGWCDGCRGFGEVWRTIPARHADSVLEEELYEERQREWLEEGETRVCTDCGGGRLNPVARAVRVHGTSIVEVAALPVSAALAELGRWRFAGREAVVARDLVGEIRQRLEFMGTVGLDYLALDRAARTLSGGESQRVRLAAQLGSNLRGVLYVLDEPTIGLHPRDNEALLDTLAALKARGNSLVVVEHDEATMRRADTIIDLGPGAGAAGGEVVAVGTLAAIRRHPQSVTGRCLRTPLRHPTRGERRPLADARWLAVEGATANNLADVTFRIPLGRLTAIAGVSGSGKSTLVGQVLKPAVQWAIAGRGRRVKADGRTGGDAAADPRSAAGRTWRTVTGADGVRAVYEVDQSPIGKTSRSTPATYIKVFDEIRRQFAGVPLARMRGFTASRFSFNNEAGRCGSCAGQGVVKVEMNFLPACYIPCRECHGRRYNAATLEVEYRGRNIGDVMEMTVAEAAGFFAAVPAIRRSLGLLDETGLGYLKLGQPSPTLSGGEAQRIKLVSELARGAGRLEAARLRRPGASASSLYLLEEPTIGLHLADVADLLKVLHRLVDAGATVVVIEHHLGVIADADHVLELGPEAGAAGGRVVACGTPEQVARVRRSRTAPFLREALNAGD